jgi:hypothetical protein
MARVSDTKINARSARPCNPALHRGPLSNMAKEKRSGACKSVPTGERRARNVARIAAQMRINVTDIASTDPIHAPPQRVPRRSNLQLG